MTQRLRTTGLAVGLALALLGLGAAPAAAEAGDARAAAAEASLTGSVLGIPVNLLDLALSEVEVAQGDPDETATETLLSINLPIIGPVPLVSAEVVTSTASSNHVRAEASSTLSDVVVSLPVGTLPPVLTLDAISSSALCHIVEAPTADVIPPVSATLLGQPIEIDLDEDIVVDIGIAEAVLRFEEIELTTDTASAIGLLLSLDVNILGLATLDLDLTIATSACERGIGELPFATSLDPVSGPEVGGTEVCISGDKFVPGYTTVHIGSNTVPAAEVEVVDFMTACFVTPPHAPGVVDVTVETPGGVSDPPLDFEYIPVGPGQPVAVSLDPDQGPETGGTVVTITGDNFVDEQTSVHIGGNTVPPAEVDVTDPTTLQFTTPPHAVGVVDVTVETPGGVSDPPLAFEYVPEGPGEPVATGIDPDSGPETGGTPVTITGDNFVDGETSVNIGTETVPPGEVTVVDPMTLQFNTPAHAPGIVDVTVETPGGVSDPPLAFEYTPVGPGQPVATGIDPDSGPETGGTPVTITGDNFVDGDTSVNIGTETVPPAEVTVISPTELQFATPAHAPGVVDVTVETSAGESDPPLDFEYTPVGPGEPVANFLDPDEGPETGGTVVLISGANFVAGQTVVHIGGNTVPAGDVTVINPMTLTFPTPPHAPGVVDVTVETPGGVSDPPLAFEYTPGGPGQPAATDIDPEQGPETGGTPVVITGDNFVAGQTSVHIGSNTVPASEVDVVNSTTLLFTTPPHAPGVVEVTVETPGGISDPPLDFEYTPGGPGQPVATEIDPDNGPETGGTFVCISGENFVVDQTSVHIGSNTVPADEVDVINSTTLCFTTPPHPPGVVDVTVETPGGISDPPLDFEYTPGGPGQPVATVIDPDHGPETGGTFVCISGENFVVDQTSVHIGSNTVPADEVDVIDSTTLCFTTPPHPPGVVDVTVETPGGISDPPLTFEYEEEGVDQRLPAALEVDFSNVISNANRVFEPGERVEVAPEWLNDGPDTLDLTGTAANFTGPAGPTYTLVDAAAGYGMVAAGASASCQETEDCYQVEAGPLSTPRPAQHWDTTFDETLSEDTEHTWTLHIGDSFLDAPPAHLFYRFIETIFHHGITVGCTSTDYCPGGASTRAQMAVFVLRGSDGADFTPPPCTPGAERFDDVPASNIFCPWIEELEERGVVAGCGGSNYCPGDTVNRNQMAVFLLRALLGSSYTPPDCSGIFTDVTCPSQFADWIEDLFQRGITEGCTASEYCPEEPNTRGQMAVFLTRTFGLVLYGP